MSVFRYTPGQWFIFPFPGATSGTTGASPAAGGPSGKKKKVDLENVLYVIKTTYTNPIDGKETPLPQHIWFLTKALNHTSADVRFQSSKSNAKGISAFRKPPGFPDKVDKNARWALSWYPADEAARENYVKKGEVWIDLDKNEFVSGDIDTFEKRKRPLIRVSKWRSDFKARRGGVLPGPTADWDKDGLIFGRDIKPFGLKKPWEIKIDKDWFQSAAVLTYYDWKAGVTKNLPRGYALKSRAKNGAIVGGGTPVDDNGTVLLVNEVTVDQFAELEADLMFQTPVNAAVDLNAPVPASGVPDKRMIVGSSTLSLDSEDHYLLPRKWCSKGMDVRVLTSSGLGPRKAWTTFAKNKSNLNSDVWTLSLDDAVIADSTGKLVNLPNNTVVTIFDHALTIRDPDSTEQHRSIQTVTRTFYLPGDEFVFDASASNAAKKNREGMTRVIHHEARFFDVRQRRHEGRVGFDQCVGAREARENDHPVLNFFQTGKNPSIVSSQPGPLEGKGVYALHLFADTMKIKSAAVFNTSTEVLLCHLMVYVPMRVKKGPRPSFPPPHLKPTDPQPPAVTQADVDSVFKQLIIAATRWDQAAPANTSATATPTAKNHVLVPRRSGTVNAGDRVVKLRHFFAPVGDPVHQFLILVTPYNKFGLRAFVRLNEMDLPVPAIATGGTLDTDIDSLRADRDTIAHEFGHVLAHFDEYIEHMAVLNTADPAKQITGELLEPRLPRFQQSGEAGKHFVGDLRAMMRSNFFPRIRYMWHHAEALNQSSAMQTALGSVKTWTPGNPTYPKKANIVHQLPSGVTTNPWRPHKSAKLQGGHGDVFLYPLGEDEGVNDIIFASTSGSSPAPFDAMALVRFKLWFRFTSSAAGNFANRQAQWDLMSRLYKLIYDGQYKKQVRFMLGTPSGTPLFKRIAICLQPHFEMEDFPNPSRVEGQVQTVSDADLQITVAFDNSASPAPSNLGDPSTITGTPKHIKVGKTELGRSVYRFALGANPATPSKQLNNAVLGGSDFANVAKTVQAMLGESSTRSIAGF